MGVITLVRHAQASFGTHDYDRLSELGFEQARALGHALARQGIEPQALVIGAQRRHRETLEALCEGLGADPAEATVLPGLNEFDFSALLDAHHAGAEPPRHLHTDRAVHFRILRDTVLAWQEGRIKAPPELFPAFAARVRDAAEALRSAAPVLAVSSGGPISLMLAHAMEAPAHQMIRLQLQMKNCAVSRLRTGRQALYLDGFNETPHIDAGSTRLLTYS